VSDHQTRPTLPREPVGPGAEGGLLGGALEGLSDMLPGMAELVPHVGETAELFRGMFDEATSKSGLGREVDDLMAKSPTLTAQYDQLRKDGWTVRYGAEDDGNFADRDAKVITIAPSGRGDAVGLVQTMAHEVGHAQYTLEPEVGMDGLTERKYVKSNTMRNLRDEGEATINNLQVRQEILGATASDEDPGVDIGVAGAQAEKYKKLFAKYKDPTGKDRGALRDDIAKLYGRGEEPSGEEGNYWDYYAGYWKELWANAHPPK
jgi:hypothetical protein